MNRKPIKPIKMFTHGIQEKYAAFIISEVRDIEKHNKSLEERLDKIQNKYIENWEDDHPLNHYEMLKEILKDIQE